MAELSAVASAGTSADNLSIQRHQPGDPPTQNVNSADTARLPARHFSGSFAICAEFAA
jgi:hypothetical protein